MSGFDPRLRPHQLLPLDADGATLPAGTYVVKVVDGVAVASEVDEYYPTVVVIPLPAGSDSTDVPAGTPDQALIIVKA